MMKKFLQLILLVSVINTNLLADDAETLSNTLWQRTLQNSCTESLTFNPSLNVFTFVSTFGKKMVGYYALEKIRKSKRLKVTFSIKLDNGFKDCSSANYNNTNQTIVLYVWTGENGKALYSATEKQGDMFNIYRKTESYSSDNLVLLQAYLTQLASNEIQQLQVKANELKNKNAQSSSNKSWRDSLTPAQSIAQQNFENKLEEERQARKNEEYLQESYRNEEIQKEYIQESYRAEHIQNDYRQESYRQEQINQDYNNGY